MGRPLGSKNRVHVPKLTLQCEACGGAFERYPSEVKRPDQGRFCSYHCARRDPMRVRRKGPEHHLWKGGGASYRPRALAHYEPRCVDCGYDEYVTLLDVHHKDFGRDNHDLDNLVILCVRCHMQRHLEAGHELHGGRGRPELKRLALDA